MHAQANLAKMPAFSPCRRNRREQRTRSPFRPALAQVPDFAFNEDVVRVFPDMIKRSVPGYPTIVENLGVLAAQFAQPNSVLYDLGSSWAR
jgi:tRNA (cmo5U34)-methyltransferase